MVMIDKLFFNHNGNFFCQGVTPSILSFFVLSRVCCACFKVNARQDIARRAEGREGKERVHGMRCGVGYRKRWGRRRVLELFQQNTKEAAKSFVIHAVCRILQ